MSLTSPDEYPTATLEAPPGSGPGLAALVASAQQAIWAIVDQLGAGDPQAAPNLVQSLDADGLPDNVDAAATVAAYNAHAQAIQNITATMQKEDSAVRQSSSSTSAAVGATRTFVIDRATALAHILTATPTLPPGETYLPAAVQAGLISAVRNTLKVINSRVDALTLQIHRHADRIDKSAPIYTTGGNTGGGASQPAPLAAGGNTGGGASQPAPLAAGGNTSGGASQPAPLATGDGMATPWPTNLSPASLTTFNGNAQNILQQVAGQFGWGSGSAWQALYNLEMGEAGFKPTVANPSSHALGLAQALGHGSDNTAGSLGNEYGGYGLTATQAQAANSGDPAAQALWMCNYIKSTYGNPVNAYNTWLSRVPHWY